MSDSVNSSEVGLQQQDVQAQPEQSRRELPPLSEIDIARVEDVARNAGKIVKEYYKSRRKKKEAGEGPDFKTARQVVTEADHASQQLIKNEVLAVYDCSFLGEEADPDDARVTSEALMEGDQWVVDPVDGTENLHGFPPMLGVSIGLMRDGKPVMGVIYDPIHNIMYSAKEGDDGIKITDEDGEVYYAKVSDTQDPEQAIVGIDFSSNQESRAVSLTHQEELLKKARAIKTVGAPVLSLAAVAAGDLEVFSRPTTKLPDVIAGITLVKAAGGKVVDYDGNDWQVGAKGIIAGSPQMVDAFAPAFKPKQPTSLAELANAA